MSSGRDRAQAIAKELYPIRAIEWTDDVLPLRFRDLRRRESGIQSQIKHRYMQGVKFAQQTTVYGKPPGWKDDDCYGLPVAQTVYNNSDEKPVPCLISCWELSPEELAEVQKTGKVYLSI